MRQQSKEYIVILFIVSVMALNYPFLDMFDTAWRPFGIPLLYFYLYLFWFLIIVLLIVIVGRSEIHESDRPSPPPLDPSSQPHLSTEFPKGHGRPTGSPADPSSQPRLGASRSSGGETNREHRP